MSENVQSAGYFGELPEPVKKDMWSEVNDRLESAGLALTYDGSMIYSTGGGKSVGELILLKPNGGREFMNLCAGQGFQIVSIRFYTCNWYNGSDSPMAEATLAKVFL